MGGDQSSDLILEATPEQRKQNQFYVKTFYPRPPEQLEWITPEQGR